MHRTLLPLIVSGALGLAACARQDAVTVAEEPVPLEPAPFQRLTAPQLRNSLIDLLGPVPRPDLQADEHPELFRSIGANRTPYTELGVDRVEVAISTATDLVFLDPRRRLDLVGCEPTEPGDACVQGFLQRFGRRAYRRPLSDTELQRWTWVATDLAEGDAWRGVHSAVAGMLQSPHHLYRVELGEPDPRDPDRVPLTDFEVAARLALLLWDAPPDEALLDAAARGELSTPEGIEGHARRLLEDDRARSAIRDFFDQYLDLGKLDDASPDPQAHPGFSEGLRQAMRTEVHLIVDDLVFRRDVDVRQLFSTRRTFVNPELAAHYGLPDPGGSSLTYTAVELPADGPRAGIQSLGAFLTMNAHPIETSPTRRGAFLLERVLCAYVPEPPGDIDLELSPADGSNGTLRDRLERHRTDPACAHCHQATDPPGFLFEHFDAVGRWRETDNGRPIDASGELDGVAVDGTADLGRVLASDPRVATCMTRQFFRHAHGRVETAGDPVSLDAIEARFVDSGHRFQALVLALVTHESFRTVAPPVEVSE